MFIEIGSTQEHFGNKDAGDVIAKTLIEITKEELTNQKVAIGLGGTHYCPTFNKILQRTDIALSHICPKHFLEFLDEEMLAQAIQRTKEKVDFVLVDWKGLGKYKEKVKELLEGKEWRRTDKI